MQLVSETILDDILTRSRRLEMYTPFELHQSIHSVIQDSQALLEKSGEDESSIQTAGQKLLRQEDVDISNTLDILKNFKIEGANRRNVQNYGAKTNEILQSSIIASISDTQEKTDTISDDFILNTIANEWEREESFRQNGSFANIAQSKVNFFSNYLHEGTKFAEKVSAAVKNPHEYVDAHATPLSDTFDLISKMMNNKANFVKGVLSFLELQTKEMIIDEVNRFLPIAERGGSIGILDTIKAYIRMHYYTKENGTNHWCVVYYALRCGLRDAAIEYIEENQSEFYGCVLQVLKHNKKGFDMAALKRYRATELTNSNMNFFKVAVLTAILEERPIKYNDVNKSIGDWIWARLHVKGATVNELGDELETLNWTLEEQQNPFLEGQLKIMCGRFEEACKWFLSQEDNIDENFHIALALHVSGFIPAKSLSDSVLMYAERVFTIDREKAIRYIASLLDQNERIECIALLSTDIDDGEQIFLPVNGEKPIVQNTLAYDDQKLSLEAAAAKAESRDQHTKAAVLLKLAGNYVRVVENECIELRQCIEDFVDTSSLEGAIQIYNEIIESDIDLPLNNLEVMLALMYLATAKSKLDEGKYAEAADFVDKSGLFPQNRSQVSEYVELLRLASEEIRSIYPTAIEIAMHAYSEYYRFTPNLYEKERGSAIMELTGSIDVDISKETQFRILNYYNSFK